MIQRPVNRRMDNETEVHDATNSAIWIVPVHLTSTVFLTDD